MGLAVRLSSETPHCASEPPHFHGNNVFITIIFAVAACGLLVRRFPDLSRPLLSFAAITVLIHILVVL